MTGVLVITGCDLGDLSFTLDLPGMFPEISWNSTRMERDAFNGRFGSPEEGRFSDISNEGIDPWKYLDREKVHRFVRTWNTLVPRLDWATGGKTIKWYNLIDIPTIALALIKGDTKYVFPCDGNHRMMARQVMGLPTYQRFVVPAELEGEYRIKFMEV